MNPQIRLLVIQAGFNDYINDNLWPAEQPQFNALLEKFAQLIVQECIDICLQNATAKDLDRWQAGVCAFDIQEHFGVD